MEYTPQTSSQNPEVSAHANLQKPPRKMHYDSISRCTYP